jgi:transcription termination factor NusB
MKPQGADAAQKAGQVQASQQVQHVDKAKQIEQAGKIQKSSLNKVTDKMTAKGMDPVAQKNEVNKTKSLLSGMVENMEKGQVSIDKLIQGGLSGKNFSNTEMLAMQAGMYKYTQELELTGKVVEKATSGLKDTLKTQV